MNALINITASRLIGVLQRSGFLAKDLDYASVRAAMVIPSTTLLSPHRDYRPRP